MASSFPGIENWSDVLLHHETKTYATRLLSAIKIIVVHHTGQPDPASVITPGAVAKGHVNERDYPGIAYHVWVTRDGKVYQVNPLTLISWHCGTDAPGDENADSIGLALEGNFVNAPPTPIQLAAARAAVAAIRAVVGDMSLVAHKDVLGASTLCPGNWDVGLLEGGVLPDARARIQAQLLAIEFAAHEAERWLGEI